MVTILAIMHGRSASRPSSPSPSPFQTTNHPTLLSCSASTAPLFAALHCRSLAIPSFNSNKRFSYTRFRVPHRDPSQQLPLANPRTLQDRPQSHYQSRTFRTRALVVVGSNNLSVSGGPSLNLASGLIYAPRTAYTSQHGRLPQPSVVLFQFIGVHS